MARRSAKGEKGPRDIAAEHFFQALEQLEAHPMFAPLLAHAYVIRREGNLCPEDGWGVVTTNGYLHVHPTRRDAPRVWLHVLAHCLLHLGFGHFQRKDRPREWNLACDCVVERFLADLKLGSLREGPEDLTDLPSGTEEHLYRTFCEEGIPPELEGVGTAGPGVVDMVLAPGTTISMGHKTDWKACLGEGLSRAVVSAINVAAGQEPALGSSKSSFTPAQRARRWFINSYPLLGSLAAGFEIVEDPVICARMGISIAAVDAESREVFVNPAAGLDDHESRFVMAHELLHVGLRHIARRQGRDPYIWNIACDYIINGWLVEMGLGELPKVGALYDPGLKGESAEAIYDRIVIDMRRYRRLGTLAGIGRGDMLQRETPDWWTLGDGIALDDLYRRCLCQGLVYHQDQGRGLLPAGLVEEIRALAQPPIPWDVELAQWFDNYFLPLERRRSYARPSRRQSVTPDIPRPRSVPVFGAEDGRTFGVLLDTSGSMERTLLAKALGAIAGYSISREVPAVRVVFCDAVTYDQGYMAPEAIADRVKVRGRGGTILQPGIELLERSEDFPKDGPVLIITDGFCDRLHIRREHAFLLPEGRHLPFVPKGRVFRIR